MGRKINEDWRKQKLSPCPFCGAEGIDFVSLNHAFDSWYVKCFYCGAMTGKCEDEETAFFAWNERPAEERYLGVIQILEKELGRSPLKEQRKECKE